MTSWGYTLSRDDATRLWQPLLERIRLPIHRALRDAQLPLEEIDEVPLVEGATRMPCVGALASNLFGRPANKHLPPDEAVAMGAAVQAAIKLGQNDVQDVVVTDVAPFSLGIAVSSTDGLVRVDGLFAPVLERGTVLPASRMRTFATIYDNQRRLDITVYQGEHALCNDNQEIGKFTLTGIPAAPAGREPIEVRFSYDLNGVLELDATVATTGRRRSVVIEQSQGKLTKQEIETSRERLARLKFHPREALPNITALARGEALFIELRGAERDALSNLLSAFRIALESQEPRRVDLARSQLIGLTAHLQDQMT